MRTTTLTAAAVATAIAAGVAAAPASAHDFTGCLTPEGVLQQPQADYPQAGPVTFTVNPDRTVTAVWTGDGFRRTHQLPTCPPVPPVPEPEPGPAPGPTPAPVPPVPEETPQAPLTCAERLALYPGAGPARRAAWGCPANPRKVTTRAVRRVVTIQVRGCLFRPDGSTVRGYTIRRVEVRRYRDGNLVSRKLGPPYRVLTPGTCSISVTG